MVQQENSIRINWRIINWLRGLAAFYVVINHARGALFSDSMMYAQHVNPKESWTWWEWAQITLMNHTSLGPTFLICFFLLSGFSMAHSLNGSPNTLGFYKRRMVRMYPPYLLGIFWAFVAFFLIWAFVPHVYYNPTEGMASMQSNYQKMAHLPTLLSNMLFMPKGNELTHQYWTIPFEVVFYLLAPWMVKRFRLAGIIVLAMYILGCILFGNSYHPQDTTNFFLQFSFEYCIFFVIGIFFYKYKEKLVAIYRINKFWTVFLVLVLFELQVIVKGYFNGGEHTKFTDMIAVLFSYIMLFASLKYNFTIGWLEKIGNYSYTLYITHWATIYATKIIAVKLGYNYYFIHNLFFWYLGVALCVAAAYPLYLLVERPTNLYLEKLRKQSGRPAPKAQPEPKPLVMGRIAEVART